MSTPSPFTMRAALIDDLDDVLALAGHLNTVNLPNDRSAIQDLLETSERSFSGAIQDPSLREYVFLLIDEERGRAVGTSMIIAQLGRRGAPYVYFNVDTEERYSATLDRHFVHTVLGTRYSYDGPTEIGGLVVDPGSRRGEFRLGTLISYVRFLFMATCPSDFQPQILAELLPPLEEDGTSLLWEAIGRRFTGMGYREADRLSKTNKEFIRRLFPAGAIYASLLSTEAQHVIGRVGQASRGVERMLSRIGFHYANRVDPFDGGPHFVAPLQAVGPVKAARRLPLTSGLSAGEPVALVARRYTEPPYFACCAVPARLGDAQAVVAPEVPAWLSSQGLTGDDWVTPLGTGAKLA